jgi:tRNA (guanine-N7-)-methyltransferase
MEKCEELMIKEPEQLKSQWKSYGENIIGAKPEQLYLELGCGKGRFTVDTAGSLPNVLYVAIEKVPDAMIIAMERAKERELKNIRFIDGDAAKLCEMFDDGEVDRIYINFCDPWPKSRDAKFRLTHPNFLRRYCQLLPIGGQIHFKTDNLPLFQWSTEQLTSEGWQLSEVTNDLHQEYSDFFMTDYEAKFAAQGLKINRLVATKTEATLDNSAPPVARMRGAALTDAKGYDESMRALEAKNK